MTNGENFAKEHPEFVARCIAEGCASPGNCDGCPMTEIEMEDFSDDEIEKWPKEETKK